ncbi:MAG: tol-pal system protein YbgF [Acidiferrobacterales bacterium]
MSFVLASVIAVPASFAQDGLPDSRSTPAPVVSIPLDGGTPPPQSGLRSSVLNLLQQVEALQSQVRKLRNEVEVETHKLHVAEQRQRDINADLDRRLGALETQNAAAAPAAGAIPPAGAATATSPAPVAAAQTTSGQQQAYNDAFDLMKEGFYDRAIAAFQAFIVKYPDAPLAGNAEYWIAEGNYVMGNYRRALKEYKKVIAKYPNGPKVPDALVKIGYTQYELHSYDKARKTLNSVIAQYPNTTVATLAATRLDQMQKEGH